MLIPSLYSKITALQCNHVLKPNVKKIFVTRHTPHPVAAHQPIEKQPDLVFPFQVMGYDNIKEMTYADPATFSEFVVSEENTNSEIPNFNTNVNFQEQSNLSNNLTESDNDDDVDIDLRLLIHEYANAVFNHNFSKKAKYKHFVDISFLLAFPYMRYNDISKLKARIQIYVSNNPTYDRQSVLITEKDDFLQTASDYVEMIKTTFGQSLPLVCFSMLLEVLFVLFENKPLFPTPNQKLETQKIKTVKSVTWQNKFIATKNQYSNNSEIPIKIYKYQRQHNQLIKYKDRPYLIKKNIVVILGCVPSIPEIFNGDKIIFNKTCYYSSLYYETHRVGELIETAVPDVNLFRENLLFYLKNQIEAFFKRNADQEFKATFTSRWSEYDEIKLANSISLDSSIFNLLNNSAGSTPVIKNVNIFNNWFNNQFSQKFVTK